MTDFELLKNIVSGVQSGNKRLASKLMTMIENGASGCEECLRALRVSPGHSYIIGVTGWPGVGKSTLVTRIAGHFLKENKQVGIIAVDPTSPVSGGSLLGDRERMRGIDGDERLFIRSMATRGYHGGIAAATDGFIKVMEAMGKEVIIVETVGVGQDQVSVSHLTDTLVMTVIPGMGDYLQALKAGITELGDIFVVNKADRKGVEEVVNDLRMVIGMTERREEWVPPIVKTVAISKSGIAELMAEIERHRGYVMKCGRPLEKRMTAAKLEIVETLKTRCFNLVSERFSLEKKLDVYARQMLEGKIDRYDLVENILREAGIVE